LAFSLRRQGDLDVWDERGKSLKGVIARTMLYPGNPMSNFFEMTAGEQY
jgi:hypothetical protein